MFTFINVTTISIALMLIGTFGIIAYKKPLDKIIMLSIVDGGFLLMLISAKYLDVAFVIALIQVISTVAILLAIIKIRSIRNVKEEKEVVRN